MTTSWERLLTSTRPAVSDDHSHRLRLRPGPSLVLWAVLYKIARCQLPIVFATSVTRGGRPALPPTEGSSPGHVGWGRSGYTYGRWRQATHDDGMNPLPCCRFDASPTKAMCQCERS